MRLSEEVWAGEADLRVTPEHRRTVSQRAKA